MVMVRAPNAGGRKLIFLLVLLVHGALIVFIGRSRTQPSAARSPHESLFVFFVERIKAAPKADAKKETLAAGTRATVARPTAPPANPLEPDSPDLAPTNAITDWDAEAHSVAAEELEKERNNRAKRAFEHKIPSAPEPGPASIFDPLPVRRAGTWDGPNRFYVTDNCYYEWDRAPRPPPTLLDHRLQTPVCKPPPKGGGDGMFKDLTPDYLKSLPEPKNH